ncbi:MAG: chemotaxis protein CheC [Dehalococcoidia bacterium]|nr:chemotaxis protein CheC [Dehalococcoidia bacterium]
MNNKTPFLSSEQLDFLEEMMNVGAGNAATALTQMLQRNVEMIIPKVIIAKPTDKVSILENPSLPVVCVKMDMINDVKGSLFFIVPEEQKSMLIRLAKEVMLGAGKFWRTGEADSKSMDLSLIIEMGNIVAGVYLTAVHDFCKLNIYHTVPILAIDMIQALLDESLGRLTHQIQHIIVIENEFRIEERQIRTFLLMVPEANSIKVLADSIGQARTAMLNIGG